MRKISYLCSSALLAAGMFQAANAQTTITLSDEIVMIGDNTVAPFGDSGNFGTAGPSNAASFRYTARERDNAGQTTRRAATFLQYDISGLTAGDVNAAGFSATFTVNHVGHLNNVNNGMDLMFGRVTGGAWNDEGSSNPDFAWGLGSTDQTTLLNNVQLFPNAVNGLSVDVTTIVQDWVLGNTNNYGFTLFGVDNGGNASNASYLDNASLTYVVPEPSTYALLAGMLALSAVAVRRRSA